MLIPRLIRTWRQHYSRRALIADRDQWAGKCLSVSNELEKLRWDLEKQADENARALIATWRCRLDRERAAHETNAQTAEEINTIAHRQSDAWEAEAKRWRTIAEGLEQSRKGLVGKLDKVKLYAEDRAAHGRHNDIVGSARIASDLFGILGIRHDRDDLGEAAHYAAAAEKVERDGWTFTRLYDTTPEHRLAAKRQWDEDKVRGGVTAISFFSGAKLCTLPPVGWWCNLDAGHDGPCPARPTEGPDALAGL